MLPFFMVAALVSAAAAPGPPAAPAKKSAFDKATLEAYVRHLFVWRPQIKVVVSDPKPAAVPGLSEVRVVASAGQASQQETFYVSSDGQKVLRGVVFDITQNPFKADLDRLKTDFAPGFGAPGAPVVLVVFSDFQCPHCSEEALSLRKEIPAAYPKQVRVYFKDLPLAQIHNWAKLAHIAGRCIYRQNVDAFWEYHDWIFQNQAQITPENLKEKVMAYAQSRNLDALQLGRCLETRATEADVDKSVAEAMGMGINATPTLFVNGRRIGQSLPWQALRQVIDFELEYQKTARNAGESCCEVKLPSPLSR